MKEKIIDKANDKLQIFFNQFIEEKVGSNTIKMMPPAEKIPVIDKFYYNRNNDTFEIVFKYNPEINLFERKNGDVSFFEYENQLFAIHIHNFSKQKIKTIKMNAITTLKNEIKTLVLALERKESISSNIVKKRKLEFTEKIVNEDLEKIENNSL